MKTSIIYKKALLLVCCFAFAICAYAQEFTVKGQLVDSASAKPVAGATVNFQEPGKKISKTMLSDQTGAFQTTLLPGQYAIRITHSSFRKKGKHLNVVDKDVDLGSIQLVAAVKSLAEVKVVGARPLVEQQADRLIYNVDEDPAAKTESASDLLRKTPYVNVDGEGNIQVNGQSNFRVLLDGRETALFSQNVKEALKGFPGANISRIEVITSPSAKYDAEGVGGIINIITKKKVAGYNGSIQSNANTLGHTGANLNINVKKGKLGISGMYNHMNNGGIRSHQLAVTTPVQPIAFARRQVGGSKDNHMYFHQGNLELSYDIDSMNTLVVYGNLARHNNEAVNQQTIVTWFANGNVDVSPYLLENTMAMPTHGFGADYIRKYKGKPQKEFNVRFNASYNRNRVFFNSQQDIGAVDRFILNNSVALNKEYTIQADIVEPLNKTTRFETGVKAILRNASSDFASQFKFSKAEPYKTDPTNSNKFAYDQNVYGGYVSLNKVFKTLTTRVGLRVEHTSVDGDFVSTNTKVRQDYTNFIPNVMLNKQFSKTFTSNFTYNFRLGRPSIQNLNPFVNNSDSLFRSFGNPNLGPQITHMFNWQNRFFKGSKFISINTGFNFANNLIIQNPTFDPSTGVTSVTGANAGQIREFALGINSSLPVGKWNFSLNATGRFARVRNKLQTEWTDGTAGNVNGNIAYKVTQLFTITCNGGYFQPLRMPNATFPDNYFYNFSLVNKMLKGKLNVTVTASNFLEEERTMNFFQENQNFKTQNTNRVPFRNFGVAVNYSFGKLKEKVSKKKGVVNDDEVE
jgi:hypothetical protein